MRSISHIAYHITNLDEARHFYGRVLGCEEERGADTWVDFNCFGHQVSLHLGKALRGHSHRPRRRPYNNDAHLGLVMPLEVWMALAARLLVADIVFDVVPVLRFAGQPGEHWTMFFFDSSGNPIEVKGYKDLDSVFTR